MDRLAKDAAEALKAGVTYGKYKALHPITETPETPEQPLKDGVKIWRICEHCGKQYFNTKNNGSKYCGVKCKETAYRLRAKERSLQKNQEVQP